MVYTIAKYCTFHTPQRVKAVFISRPQSLSYLPLHIEFFVTMMQHYLPAIAAHRKTGATSKWHCHQTHLQAQTKLVEVQQLVEMLAESSSIVELRTARTAAA